MREIILRIKDVENFQHKKTYQEIVGVLNDKNISHDGLLISVSSKIGYVFKDRVFSKPEKIRA